MGVQNTVPDSGANAALILEPEQLAHEEPTEPPADCERETHVAIDGWSQEDDGVPADRLDQFFDEHWLEDTDDLREHVAMGTKLGSAPSWVQSPQMPAGDGWTFVAQLSCTHRLPRPAPSPDALGCTVVYRTDGGYASREPKSDILQHRAALRDASAPGTSPSTMYSRPS